MFQGWIAPRAHLLDAAAVGDGAKLFKQTWPPTKDDHLTRNCHELKLKLYAATAIHQIRR
jgi:hypothetical protein